VAASDTPSAAPRLHTKYGQSGMSAAAAYETPNDDGVSECSFSLSVREAELLFDFRLDQGQPGMGDPVARNERVRFGEALFLQKDFQLDSFNLEMVGDLGLLVSDLVAEELILRLACQISTGSHRESPGCRFGEAADDHCGSGGRGAREACHYPERNE
jgi:hypothetical protein